MKQAPILYGMTAAQNILFYSQKFTLHKQVNNIFTLMLLERPLDFSMLRQAVRMAYDQVDALHIRLKKVKGRVVQYFLPDSNPLIGILDFTGKTQAQMDHRLYRLASRPFYLLNRPLSRVWMVRSPEGMCGIFLGVSHMIMDSWAICMLMKHVADLYRAEAGETDPPKPPALHEPLLAKDLDYKNTEQYQKDLDFWRAECRRAEPWYTHINGPSVLEAYRRKMKNPGLQAASGFTLRTRALHEVLVIPAADVAKLSAFCEEHNLPLQALFMLGVRTCLSKRNGRQKDISIYSTVARRGTLAEKRSGGTRVHPVIFRTVISATDSFLSAARQVAERQTEVYRHAEIDMLEVKRISDNAYRGGEQMGSYQSVSLTFQPVQLALSGGVPVHTKWYCNGVSSQPFYLTVMDDDGSGGLRCYYEYQRSVVKRHTVLGFHDDLVNVMLTGVENPGLTVGQLLDLLPERDA